jgi:hypothetical protein
MFNLIKNIFGSKNTINPVDSIGIEVSQEDQENYNQLLVKFALTDLSKVDFFDNNKLDIIISHLLSKINLFKSEEYLSIEEKKVLGINTKLRISKELIDIFDKTKIQNNIFKNENPKDLLLNILHNARSKATIQQNIDKYKKLNIKYVELQSSGDDRTCKWCLKQDNKKISINTDVVHLINENCKCVYNRSCVLAIVN